MTENSLGRNRAEESLSHLAELNPHVKVSTHSGVLVDPSFLENFSVIVLTDSNLEEQLSIAEIAREKEIAVIIAQSRGLFGQIFCDFGPSFTVYDNNGENPISVLISGITREKNGVVACIEDTRHGFEDGDVIRFTEVKGMTEINGKEFKIRVTGPCDFTIGDTSTFSNYSNGGLATQVKQSSVMNFVSNSFNECSSKKLMKNLLNRNRSKNQYWLLNFWIISLVVRNKSICFFKLLIDL